MKKEFKVQEKPNSFDLFLILVAVAISLISIGMVFWDFLHSKTFHTSSIVSITVGFISFRAVLLLYKISTKKTNIDSYIIDDEGFTIVFKDKTSMLIEWYRFVSLGYMNNIKGAYVRFGVVLNYDEVEVFDSYKPEEINGVEYTLDVGDYLYIGLSNISNNNEFSKVLISKASENKVFIENLK